MVHPTNTTIKKEMNGAHTRALPKGGGVFQWHRRRLWNLFRSLGGGQTYCIQDSSGSKCEPVEDVHDNYTRLAPHTSLRLFTNGPDCRAHCLSDTVPPLKTLPLRLLHRTEAWLRPAPHQDILARVVPASEDPLRSSSAGLHLASVSASTQPTKRRVGRVECGAGGDCFFAAVAGCQGHGRLADHDEISYLRTSLVAFMTLLGATPGSLMMQPDRRQAIATPGVWAEEQHAFPMACLLHVPINVYFRSGGSDQIDCAQYENDACPQRCCPTMQYGRGGLCGPLDEAMMSSWPAEKFEDFEQDASKCINVVLETARGGNVGVHFQKVQVPGAKFQNRPGQARELAERNLNALQEALLKSNVRYEPVETWESFHERLTVYSQAHWPREEYPHGRVVASA